MIYLLRKVSIRHKKDKLMLKIVSVIYGYLPISIWADSSSYFPSSTTSPINSPCKDTIH
ncbi:hypothetical protein [Pseudomonas phage vB_Pae_CF74b]|nr:hypothetical protein [Pseudomonas phage vB_Pae_CF57a]QBI80205.1 hypothetical protein [Pseudomonas phage vB_Pae_CF74b]QBI80408.1 hypothetical protein [Pseudomonas phage vB_Pae_CF121b]QBI80474.1 hypothetical protein [Pseudomonas phage vB_Pae_CF124b]QBI80838.1 hypothetical protein [Pseudomonas phage vB_Pae_BR161a]QBI81011.1 hypothetical protein [Pseudomonas phage vB_Pae_BR141b]